MSFGKIDFNKIFGVFPTLERNERLDLGIAFFSGMTAAYASGRSKVMTTLAGVAIAAALVPPLAVVGIALTHGSPLISANAAILLVTNLVAIILGAAIVFRMFKIHISRRGAGMPTWVRKVTMPFLFAAISNLGRFTGIVRLLTPPFDSR